MGRLHRQETAMRMARPRRAEVLGVGQLLHGLEPDQYVLPLHRERDPDVNRDTQSSMSSIRSRPSRLPSPTRTPRPARSSTTSRLTSATLRAARWSTRSLRAGNHRQRR